MNLPKVEIRISNPSKTEECRIWDDGTAWEEQNKWFSLRPGATGKDWELHPKPRDYTARNSPRPQTIPAGKSLVFKYDFSDGWWVLPEGFVPGNWAYEIQAHLRIRFEVDAHRFGIFTGHVASGWHDTAGREVEKPGKLERDQIHAAIEARQDFPWERLTASLEKWDAGTLPGKQSVADYFGEFPWEKLKCRYIGSGGLYVFLPDEGVLRFCFYVELPDSSRTVKASTLNKRQKGTIKVENLDWLPANDTLQKTPARSLSSIALFRNRERNAEFKRAFDRAGRIDKAMMEDVWKWHW